MEPMVHFTSYLLDMGISVMNMPLFYGMDGLADYWETSNPFNPGLNAAQGTYGAFRYG